MTHWRDNLGWLAGSIVTAIALAIGWLFSSGVVVNLLFLLVGSGIAYFVQTRTQKRLWKREDAITMIDKVYGPIFREMSLSLESVGLGESPNYESVSQLKETMRNNFYFFRIKPDLKTDFHALMKRLERYAKIQSSTHTLILQKIRDAVKKLHKRDAGVTPDQVWLALYSLNDAIQFDKINLEQTILRKISPSDFIEDMKGYGKMRLLRSLLQVRRRKSAILKHCAKLCQMKWKKNHYIKWKRRKDMLLLRDLRHS